MNFCLCLCQYEPVSHSAEVITYPRFFSEPTADCQSFFFSSRVPKAEHVHTQLLDYFLSSTIKI